jgi:hypothetical protein
MINTGSNPVLTTKLNYMATLETQYKNYLLENPNSKFTFDEWKEWLGNQLNEALEDLKKKSKKDLTY